MSWQVYVDAHLVATKKVSRAAILGQQGGIWAASPGFTLAADEQAALLSAFNDPEKVQGSGVRLAGQKYLVLQANEQHIYGKKQADGCVIVKTKQAIIVAVYDGPDIQAPEATPIVEKLGDYLISVGY